MAATAVAAGAVSYIAAQPAGVKRDVLFVYDLRLPPDFEPAPQARSALFLICTAHAVWLCMTHLFQSHVAAAAGAKRNVPVVHDLQVLPRVHARVTGARLAESFHTKPAARVASV